MALKHIVFQHRSNLASLPVVCAALSLAWQGLINHILTLLHCTCTQIKCIYSIQPQNKHLSTVIYLLYQHVTMAFMQGKNEILKLIVL